MDLIHRIDNSEYLSKVLARNPDLESYARGEQAVDEAVLLAQIQAGDDLLEAAAEAETASQALRRIKQRFSLLWALADLTGSLDFSKLSRLQSRFADHSLRVALEIVWQSQPIARYFHNPDQLPASSSGLFIFALGKLGGMDLNFSSDIDLVAFYDRSQLTVRPSIGASHAVTECLKALQKLLSSDSPDGFVWRVDWRLRPHASTRSLAMVADKALDFYHYQSRPWHRLAMIKARSVAGNLVLADAFLADLNSYLWRRNLDYRALDDIAALKTRINLEHPSLVEQRSRESFSLDEGRGMNLKLGHGGIREIEFVVNASQLVWGGRKPGLRVSNTLQAMAVLVEEGLLSREDGRALQAAYVFLRQAENRLQMRSNAQEYHLPDDQQELEKYLQLCAESDWSEFNRKLTSHRKRVYQVFSTLFDDEDVAPGSEDTGTVDWHSLELDERAAGIVEAWEEGFTCYGLAPGHARQFTPLLNTLSEEIHRCGCDASDAIVRTDDYFRRLPPGGQYFRLLLDFPWLLKKMVAPVLLSPTMSSLLQQSPHIIDRYLEHQTAIDAEIDTTIVFSGSDYEYRLENLRRLTNEELYLRYSLYFEGRTKPVLLQKQLTRLAEQMLHASVRVASEEMQLDKAPVAVIGFGKLGAKGMMPKSDLDLVYLCGSMEEHRVASQYASRLNTVINSPMREGRVYELDTRLRPSGQSGSVTISLDSYYQHQLERAHTWSHLALVPARSVAGDEQIGLRFQRIREEILCRPREMEQFRLDCARMLKRVRDQKIRPAELDQFTAKHRPGGLFELEYLLYCLAIPACVEHPELAALDFDQLVDALASMHGREILTALDTLRTLQMEIRLFGRDGEFFYDLPEPVFKHLLGSMGCDKVEQLTARIGAALEVCTSQCERFFQGIDWSELNDWQEAAVNWR